MADDSGSVRMAIGTAVGGASIALLAGASCWLGMKAYRDGRFSRGWRRVRVWALGGVTTLGQALAYDCAMCGHSLEQREEVRTLSCGHVFHLRKGPKCGSNIDEGLRENRTRCPACYKTVHPVLLWKAPPTLAPLCHLQRDVGFGGSGAAAVGVGPGATAAAGVGWTRGDRGIRRRCGSRMRYCLGRRRSKHA